MGETDKHASLLHCGINFNGCGKVKMIDNDAEKSLKAGILHTQLCQNHRCHSTHLARVWVR